MLRFALLVAAAAALPPRCAALSLYRAFFPYGTADDASAVRGAVSDLVRVYYNGSANYQQRFPMYRDNVTGHLVLRSSRIDLAGDPSGDDTRLYEIAGLYPWHHTQLAAAPTTRWHRLCAAAWPRSR